MKRIVLLLLLSVAIPIWIVVCKSWYFVKRHAIVLLCLIPSLAFPAITRVQSKTATTNSATSLAVVLDSTPTAGNIIVLSAVFVSSNSASNTIDLTTSNNISWLWVSNNSGASSGQFAAVGRVLASPSATITVSAASGSICLVAVEYAPSDSIHYIRLNRMATATGTGGTIASGATATTDTANELWIGMLGARCTSTQTFSSPTNSFAIVAQTSSSLGTSSDHAAAVLERIVSSTGTANAGATLSGTVGTWGATVMTFDEIYASTPTPTPSATATATATATNTPTPTPSATVNCQAVCPTPTATPTNTPTPTATATVTPTSTPSATAATISHTFGR